MTKQTIKVFVAEDEPQVAEAIGFDIKKIVATYPSAALELCVVTGHTEASKTQMLAFRPHLAIFDHNLSPGNGFELARALRDVDSSAYIVLNTAYGKAKKSSTISDIDAWWSNFFAADPKVSFCAKPDATLDQRLSELIPLALGIVSPSHPLSDDLMNWLCSVSEAMRAVCDKLVPIVAQATQIDLLLLGPAGSGKTRLVPTIHGVRRNRGLLSGNTTAFQTYEFVAGGSASAALALFGAVPLNNGGGRRAGSLDERLGKLASVQGGTLFLDEVGHADTDMLGLLKGLYNKHKINGRSVRQFDIPGSRSGKSVQVECDLILATDNTQFLDRELSIRSRYKPNTVTMPTLMERLDDVPGVVEAMFADGEYTIDIPALQVFVARAQNGMFEDWRDVFALVERAKTHVVKGSGPSAPQMVRDYMVKSEIKPVTSSSLPRHEAGYYSAIQNEPAASTFTVPSTEHLDPMPDYLNAVDTSVIKTHCERWHRALPAQPNLALSKYPSAKQHLMTHTRAYAWFLEDPVNKSASAFLVKWLRKRSDTKFVPVHDAHVASLTASAP